MHDSFSKVKINLGDQAFVRAWLGTSKDEAAQLSPTT